jgi:two-component system response regulator (stage 0 sporulation protein F)
MPTPRILVVDDDSAQCGVVGKLLADQGYLVHSATDSSVALDMISQNRYDLLVLDYQMPGFNGVEVFRHARQMQPEIAGVFLTAYTNINTVFPAIDAGVERVLSKPVNASELIPVVKELVGGGSANPART